MDAALLADLRCPACGRELFHEPLGQGEGLLDCGAGHLYPVAGGIPRMLPDALVQRPEFVARHRALLDARGWRTPPSETLARFARRNAQVQDRFTFEWLRYPGGDPEEEERIFFEETMWRPDELPGKSVLDAGCGMGRFTRVAARHARRVVALDLGGAVDRVARDAPDNLFVVQGDLLAPPLRPGAFDAAYSLGVLHHTPDSFGALSAVRELVAPGGLLSAWVYGRAGSYREFARFPWAGHGPAALAARAGTAGRLAHYALVRWREATSGALRCWTTRLRAEELYRYTSWLARLGRCSLVNLLLPVSTDPDPAVRKNDTFDWYAPQHQHHHTQREVDRWLERLDLVREGRLVHGFIPKVGFRARRR